MADNELHRHISSRLAERDQRYTDGRRQIVGALVDHGPMTLPDLLAACPELAQSSAYRNLSALEDAGVVRRLVHGADHAHYELAEDLTEHHHHLVCEGCGLIRDVTLPEGVEHSIDDALARLAAAHGFTTSHHTIDLHGRCADCA